MFLKDLAMELDKIQNQHSNQDAQKKKDEVYIKDMKLDEMQKHLNQARKEGDENSVAAEAEGYGYRGYHTLKLDEMQKQHLNQAREEGDENSAAAEGYSYRGYQSLNKATKEGDENSVEVKQGYPVDKQGYPVEVEQGYPVEVEQGYRKVNTMGPGYRKVIAMILDEMKKIRKQHLEQAIQEERDFLRLLKNKKIRILSWLRMCTALLQIKVQ